jgi:hypothetical protein
MASIFGLACCTAFLCIDRYKQTRDGSHTPWICVAVFLKIINIVPQFPDTENFLSDGMGIALEPCFQDREVIVLQTA